MLSEKNKNIKSTVSRETAKSNTATVSLIAKHYKECVEKRGLDPRWVTANCFSIDKETAIKKLGYPNILSGGIWLEGEQGIGHFKPDIPWKIKNEKTGKKKLTKYINSQNYDAFLPKNPDDKEYWINLEGLKLKCIIINNHPYVLATEGVFKAIASCSNGVPCVGLLGVEMGLTSSKDDPQGKRYLVSVLEMLVKAGIGIIIAFDADAATKKEVRSAQYRLAQQLKKFNIPVYSITGMWEVDESFENKNKGIDDFIMNHGGEEFRKLVAQAETIEKWEQQFKDEEDENKVDESQRGIAKLLSEKYRVRLAWHIDNQCWYFYNYKTNGLWEKLSKEQLAQLVTVEVDNIATKPKSYSFIESVIKFLRNALAIPEWKETKGLIPLEDCVVRISDQKILEHSPGYRFLWQLPYKWSDRKKGCEPIKQWFAETMKNDYLLIESLLAYLKAIVCGRSDYHRFLECIGEEGTGKSTYLSIARWVVGKDNTAITSLKNLENNKFETASFYGKKLVLITDADKYKGDVSTLKALTGKDPIRNEEKGKQQKKGFVFGGMVGIAGNQPIQSSDGGLLRRRISLMFRNKLNPEDQRDLEEEFKTYLAGLLEEILSIPDQRMWELVKCTEKFVPSLRNSTNNVLLETNNVASWFDENIILKSEKKVYVGTLKHSSEDRLYSSYYEYSLSVNEKKDEILKVGQFGKLLKRLIENELKLDGVTHGRDSQGSYIKGISIRTDVNKHDIRPISGLTVANNTFHTEKEEKMPESDGCNDRTVTVETPTHDSFDSNDSYFENKDNKKEKEKNNNFDITSEEKLEENASFPSKLSSERDTAISEPSQMTDEPITDPPPPNTHSQQFSTTDDPWNDGSTGLKVGDTVVYCGETPHLKWQYAGILKVNSFDNSYVTCRKPDGSYTSWIDPSELRLVSPLKQ